METLSSSWSFVLTSSLLWFCLPVSFSPMYRQVHSAFLCVFVQLILRQDAALYCGFCSVLDCSWRSHISQRLSAEVDTMALHAGWAFIILSYCKVICMQTKLRKSNLFREWHINLGGCGPWQCTAGAKLAWAILFFFYMFKTGRAEL